MATWFDRQRGLASGRILPQAITPTAGDYVFVLGAEQGGDAELARLRDGDYAQIAQDIDLTGVDAVGATMETVGVVMQSFYHPVGLADGPNVLALWTLDQAWVHASNDAQPGVNLAAQGDLALAQETYSAVASYCRRVPAGSTTAMLLGANAPAIWGAPLTTYTLLWWMAFDADAYVSSDGIDPIVLSCVDPGVGGLEIFLSGETGVGPPHRWWIAQRHVDGLNDETRLFLGHEITTTTGWHMCGISYDSALVGAARGKLYVDGAYVTDLALVPNFTPGVAGAAAPVQLADPALTGDLDQVCLYDVALDAPGHAAAYAACVAPQVVGTAEWRMEILIDGTVYCTRTIAASERPRQWRDFFAPARHLVGVHTVAFRLHLVEV